MYLITDSYNYGQLVVDYFRSLLNIITQIKNKGYLLKIAIYRRDTRNGLHATIADDAYTGCKSSNVQDVIRLANIKLKHTTKYLFKVSLGTYM